MINHYKARRRKAGLLGSNGMVILDGEEYLTGGEAAQRLGVKPSTLYAYVSRGILRSYRQGIKRQRLYRRAEVDALVRLDRRTTEIPPAESWIRD
jgi:citrate synthase